MNCKLWFDIAGAPHALFFNSMVKRALDEGFNVVITVREYGYAVPLSGILFDSLDGVKIYVVGSHGTTIVQKLYRYTERIRELSRIVKRERPTLLISKASPEAVRVAYTFNIPSITVYDNEHNVAQCKLTFPLSSIIIVPACFPRSKLIEYSANHNVLKFRGVCEIANVLGFKPNLNKLRSLGLEPYKFIIARPEPYDSSYHVKKPEDSVLVKIFKNGIGEEYKVLLYPRNHVELKIYSKILGDKLVVANKVIPFPEIAPFSHVVIGAGGTMTREAALLGVPTVSCYPGDSLGVMKLLESFKLLFSTANPKEIKNFIRKANDQSFRLSIKKRAENFLRKVENPALVVWRAISTFSPKSAQ